MTVEIEPSLDTAPAEAREEWAEAGVHALLLRLAGSLPDRVLVDAREALATGRLLDVVQAVAFEAVSQPLQLDADEIAVLREGLALGGGESYLSLAF